MDPLISETTVLSTSISKEHDVIGSRMLWKVKNILESPERYQIKDYAVNTQWGCTESIRIEVGEKYKLSISLEEK